MSNNLKWYNGGEVEWYHELLYLFIVFMFCLALLLLFAWGTGQTTNQH